MRKFVAVGIGEVLWDMLPEGRKLGGAPANFAYHVNALGGTGIVVSRVGNDELGREALDLLDAHGVDVGAVAVDSEHVTGYVEVDVDGRGVASYTFPADVAWDFLEPGENTSAVIAQADAVCFGTLAQRGEVSRRTIRAFLAACRPEALKIFDINLRQNFYSQEIIHESLKLADVLKINDEELRVVADLLAIPGDDRAVLEELLGRYRLKLAALTRGEHGSLLMTAAEASDRPGLPAPVADTVGAGDSFTAALALGMLGGWELDRINRHAVKVAAYVCTQPGAMPLMPEEFIVE